MGTDSVSPVDELRRALVSKDVVAAAHHMGAVHLAVPVRDGAVATVRVAEGSGLPVFLSWDSWEAFDSDAEVRALEPGDFLRMLESVAPDVVIVDPALTSAMVLPAGDVAELLRGQFRDATGSLRIAGVQGASADDALRIGVRDALRRSGATVGVDRVWVLRRPAGAGSVPTVAVAHDDAPGAPMIADALQGADLPRDLELIVLDEQTTRTAGEDWGAWSIDLR